jgi:hypothetical protein
MKKMDVQAVIEYEEGYMKIGMQEAYTIRMLTYEFWEITQRQWEFYPLDSYRRWIDGSIVHGTTWERNEHLALDLDSMSIPPAKVLEERGRGTESPSIRNQGKLLQYWAWSQTPIGVGIFFPDTNFKIEYWMNIMLQPVEGDEEPTIYLRVLKELWMERLREVSEGIAVNLASLGHDFGKRMRYLCNSLRVWFVPIESYNSGQKRSLAEEPCTKDKWYSYTDIMAFTIPTLPDAQIREEPTLLFGPGSFLQERYDDPEVLGCKIALIAFEQIRVQRSPNGLDRMRSTFQKQVAYDQRVMEAEDRVAGINCDIADCLLGMSLEPEEQVVICVNGSEKMKRNEEAIGGQLWMQGDRQMTASNKVLDGMANSRESAIRSAAVEAVTWRHELEPKDGPRKGQRVVIYPTDLPQLEQVLSTKDPTIDSVDGHPIAYTAILQETQKFENPPIFVREDSEQVTSNPEIAEKVPGWMNLASQVATGNRRRVLEDGTDKMNSDDEEIEEMKPDEQPNMYTPEMDPKKGPIMLSANQVAAQKAADQALKALKQPQSSQTPVKGSSDDDDPNGSEYVWSSSKGYFRKNKHWNGPTVTSVLALFAPEPQKALPAPEPQKALPAPSKGRNVTQEKLVPPPMQVSAPKPKKAAASQKAPKPMADHHQMVTRGQAASRAGGLRGMVGSGSIGYVCDKSSPSSKPGS